MHNLEEDSKVVGSKQTLRAIDKGQAKVVYIAKDACSTIVNPIIESAKAHHVDIVYYDSMKALGEACSVAVKTAVAAIIQ